jgi:chromosome condensin MukBEF complex kleisin-like MukF subunit
MKEIIAEYLVRFLEDTPFDMTMTFDENIGWGGPAIEVWQMSDDIYDAFVKHCDAISEDEWEKRYPNTWWRSANGSNMGAPSVQYVINDKKLLAWDGVRREDLQGHYDEECEELRESEREVPSFSELEDEFYPRRYSNLIEYLCEEIGASQPRNVAALVSDLAKYNHMTVGELLRGYCTIIVRDIP